jgi:predicted dehydrogenase
MSKVFRVAAIGTAWAAQSPLPAFSTHPRVKLVAIASARLARAQEAARTFGAEHAYDDYRAMIDETSPDIVYVGGPVGLHKEMVLTAIAKQKHVICEKPLAVDAGEGREMCAAAEAAGIAHLVTFTMRHYPGPTKVKEIVTSGALGELRHVNISFWFSMPAHVPRTWGWLNDAAQGGGMLNAMGSHYIDLVRHFGGDIAEVQGRTRIWRKELPDSAGQPRAVTADDSFALTGSLANGALLTMHMSSEVSAGSAPRIELYGSRGTLVMDGAASIRVTDAASGQAQAIEIGEPIFHDDAMRCKVPRFGQLISDMAHWIESGSEASPNMRDALRCQEVIDALRRSEREQRMISLENRP